MKLLLDTQIVVWLALGSDRLKPDLTRLIAETPDVAISVVARWEMGIKAKRGQFPQLAAFDALLDTMRFEIMTVGLRHVQLATGLPAFHKDPFDRMIAAQAICDERILVTSDRILTRYGARTLIA